MTGLARRPDAVEPPVVADPARLAALEALAVLDTPPETGFDDVVRLATRLCAAPVALISLVAADRQWFKARAGFPLCETDLDRSVCKFALDEPDLLVVPDLAADPRTAGNPLVTGEPRIRFYAGAPLRTSGGHAVGSLCVIDTVPRPGGLTPEQADDLRALGRQVSGLLGMRRALGARDALLAEQEAVRREREILARTQANVAAAGGSLDAILEAVTAGALRAVPAAASAAVGLIDGDALAYRTVAGGPVPHRDLRVPLGDSPAGRCVLADAPLLAEDVPADDLLADDLLADGPAPPAAGAAVLAPIARGGRAVGVLELRAGRAGAFQERDLDLVRLFAGAATAGLAAVAEEEAARAQRRAQRRLDLLAQVSAALLTATDPSRALEPILATAAGRLGFEQSYLYDIAPDGRHLMLAQSVGASEAVQATLRLADYDGPLCGIVAETRRKLVLTGVLATDEPRYALARRVGINAFAGYPVMSRGAIVGVISFCATSEAAFDAEALGFFETVARYLSAVRERLDGERALRESDARSRLAQAAGHVGTFEVDVDTGLMSVSPEFARIYGRPAVGLYSTDAFEALIVPEDCGLASSEDSRRDGSAGPDVEYRIRRADDGQLRWIARRADFVRDATGRVIRMVGTVQDITDRRAVQEALQASEAYWRGLFERLGEGFLVGEVVRDEAGRVADWRYVDVNAAWGALVGIDPAEVTGRTIRAVFPGIEDARVHEFADVVETGSPVSFARQVGTAGRWYEGRAFPLGSERFGALFLEVTARVEAGARRDALLALGERLREADDVPAIVGAASEVLFRATGATRAGYGVVDMGCETVEVLTDWGAPGSASVAGLHDFRAYGAYIDDLKRGEVVSVDDVTTDPRTRDAADALLAIGVRVFLNVPILERGRLVGIGFVHYAHAHTFTDDERDFVRAVADRAQSAVARLRAEADQRLLNEEISHRLKNTLAMVLSIAGQTLRGVPDRAPVEVFEQRIHALSCAHDVLLRRSWAAAPARAVVEAVMAGVGHGDRVDVSGPDLDLGPRATLSLSLLLHELATNAAKYGALSVPGGRVAIAWRLDGDGAEREVALDWAERGGPPVPPPDGRGRTGFGSRLIRMGLAGTGAVDLRYPPSGFQATMRAPLVQLQGS